MTCDPLVILAAGAASRLRRSLDDAGAAALAEGIDRLRARVGSRGKGMIPVGPSRLPLLDHQLALARRAGIRDVVFVIGEHSDDIRRRYLEMDGSWHGLRMHAVVQPADPRLGRPAGTADAAERALHAFPDLLGGMFLLCNSDNLYSDGALRALCMLGRRGGCIGYDASALRFDGERLARFGLLRSDGSGALVDIVEKPDVETAAAALQDGARITMNLWRFDARLLLPALIATPPHPERGERELPAAVRALIRSHPGSMTVLPRSEHVPDLTSAADIDTMDAWLAADFPDGLWNADEEFRVRFDADPLLDIHAPGRINLIGEHVDYNGFPVLPMAIERGIRMLVRPRRDALVRLRNSDAHYGDRDIPCTPAPPGTTTGDWSAYPAAALQGLFDAGLITVPTARGFDAVVSGSLPAAAGLSSSSALVVATAIAALLTNGRSVDRADLAHVCASAERYAGLEGGGMDQTVALLAEAGHALRIDFHPLRTRTVAFPEDACIVVCNSLVTAAKTRGAKDAYNTRVAETRAAAALLAADIGLSGDAGVPLLAALSPEALGLQADSWEEWFARVVPDGPCTTAQLAGLLGRPEEVVRRSMFTTRAGESIPEPPRGWDLRRRARHVFDEARRTERAIEALTAGDLAVVGALMNASHESCRDLYEVSCPELDTLVAAARSAGAFGARLTGAGFGGCAIALARRADAGRIRDAMRTAYRDEPLRSAVTATLERDPAATEETVLEQAVFVCRPSSGAQWTSVGDADESRGN